MANRPLPPVGVLRQLLRYEPDTGKLFWLPRPIEMFATKRAWSTWNSRYAGEEALASEKGGYRYGSINGGNVYAHRAAWALMMGEWPAGQIDHINHTPGDNRWNNLRSVTLEENRRNMSMMRSNTSGVCGVSWHSQNGKWCAFIGDRKRVHLGYFNTIEDAAAARHTAEESFGFHPNHGKTAA